MAGGELGAAARRIHGIALALDQKAVEGVLDVGRGVGRAPQALGVAFVLGEQCLRRVSAIKVIGPQGGMLGAHRPLRLPARRDLGDARLGVSRAPGPGVAEPQRRQQMQGGRLRAAVGGDDADVDLVRRGLGVAHFHVPVAAVVECARVEQGEWRIKARAARVLMHQPAIRVLGLGILVEIAHPGVGGRGVEIEVVLLDVLAVVALVAGEAEGALLEDRIAAVPQRQREAQTLLLVADAAHAILIPAVGAGARLVMVEVLPGVAVRAVVLAHRAPGALRQIRPPQAPVFPALALGFQALPFRIQNLVGYHRCLQNCGGHIAHRREGSALRIDPALMGHPASGGPCPPSLNRRARPALLRLPFRIQNLVGYHRCLLVGCAMRTMDRCARRTLRCY